MGILYKVVFLPVHAEFTDGCHIINKDGEVFTYNKDEAWNLDTVRVAEPFLVSYEYNMPVVIGRPSPAAKWLKKEGSCKAVDCQEWLWNENDKKWVMPRPPDLTTVPNPLVSYVRVKCPCCQILH